jgi:hypothetical protein
MSDIVKETLEGHLKDVSIAYSQIFKSLVLFLQSSCIYQIHY